MANNSSCPVSVSDGQPACAESLDPGSHAPQLRRSRHVGNPIDIVSGNNYQGEVDVRLGDSRLPLVRHYNSVNTSVNLGLGNGWRHSYSVLLVAGGSKLLKITQSDGRIIEFRKKGDVFQSLGNEDGYVLSLPGNKHRWKLPNGNDLLFHGSYLIKLSRAKYGALTLYYQNRRLHSVTDDQGRSIEFRYTPGKIGLRAYDPSTNQSPAGHLSAVVLPDGSAVQYRYDNRQNLVSVTYPRKDQSKAGYRYEYADENNSTLLTERRTSIGKIIARWAYDETGRVSSYRKGNHIRTNDREPETQDLRLTYLPGADANSGISKVSYRNGFRTEFYWRLDEHGRVVEIKEKHFAPLESPTDIKQIDKSGGTSTEPIARPRLTYSDNVLIIQAVDDLGHPNNISYQLSSEAIAHELDVQYSQTGKLLKVDWQSGLMQAIKLPAATSQAQFKEFIKTHWSDGTREDDILAAISKRSFIEADAKLFLNNSNIKPEPGTKITADDLQTLLPKQSSRFIPEGASRSSGAASDSPYSNACFAEPLQDCDMLLQARDYAELSDCAYEESACHTRYFEANLDQLGVSWSDLVVGSFRSLIFYDRWNDEYIVTFAGTNPRSGGDLVNDLQQEIGRPSSQYMQAIDLARQLTNQNPELTFRFTGHSLGGGLATAAAAATDHHAIVFNPAAIDPLTATNYQFEYDNAEYNTDVFSVDGEILSNIQNNVDFTNEAQGTIHTLPRPQFSWIQANVGQNPLILYGTRHAFVLHGMDAVRQSLSDLIKRFRCE